VSTPTVAERIEALLDHLSLKRVHAGACMSADWEALVGPLKDRVSTLALVAPHLNKGVPQEVESFEQPTVVVAGGEGPPAERARALADRFSHGAFVPLPGYSSPIWADIIADRLDDVSSALHDHWSSVAAPIAPSAVSLPPGQGMHEGLQYRVQGRGPPLLLLPLSLSPSQWDPLVERLTDSFSVITLGGAHLGAVALLEARARSGYGELVATVLDEAGLGAGGMALEVGCGSGALSRELLARSDPSAQVVATDLNPYLLAEARALAEIGGIAARIRFEEADGAQLRFSDNQFDMVFSSTVLEEAPADKMLSELARVTKPGGRLVAITRAIDVDWWVNLDVPEDIRRSLNANGPETGAGVGADGCADASLYARAQRLGLSPLRMGPQFAAYRDGERLQDVLARLGSTLPQGDRAVFDQAAERGRSNGTLMVCEPFHCLVGEVLA
jgi:SAM-dependent methyltransferase